MNIYELDEMISTLINKYGMEDEAVIFYQKKRIELVKQIKVNISKNLQDLKN
tara:strand:+ start:1288 stop:1443 length:156 start_codon:yes stop_codon:yes gene_type:complete